MEHQRQTDHERTKALAYLIYLNENKPADSAEDHWKRAEESLRRLDEAPVSPLLPDADPDRHERAILRPVGHEEIAGFALLHRRRPKEGAKFYPAEMQDVNVSLSLPATLHLEESGETFNIVRLMPGHGSEACYQMSFQE